MATYLHPGVYVEEIPSGSKPIEAVATSTAAFIGYATKGPIGTPRLILKWDDYAQQYGGIRDTVPGDPIDEIGHSVSAFYQNGGKKAYIVRLAESANAAHLLLRAPEQQKPVRFTAVSEGSWGNAIHVRLSTLVGSGLYEVAVGRLVGDGAISPRQRFEESETFEGLRLDDDDHPDYLPTRINNQSELIRAQVEPEGELPLRIGSITSGDILDPIPVDLEGKTIEFAVSGDEEHPLHVSFPSGVSTREDLRAKIQEKIDERKADPPPQAIAYFKAISIDENKLVLAIETNSSEPVVTVGVSGTAAVHLNFSVIPELVEPEGELPLRIGSITSGDILDPIPVDLEGKTIEFAVSGDEEHPLHVSFPSGVSTREDLRAKIQEKIDERKADPPPQAIAYFKAISIDENKLVLAIETNSSEPVVTVGVSGTAAVHLNFSVIPELVEPEGELPLRIGSITSGDILDPIPVDLEGKTIEFAVSGDEEHPLHVSFPSGVSTREDLRAKIQEKIDERKADPPPQAIAYFKAISIDENKLVLAIETNSSEPVVTVGVSGTAAVHLNFSDKLVEPLEQAHNLTDGGDGNRPTKPSYDRAFAKLTKIRDVSIICLPGMPWGDDSQRAVVQAAIGHAEDEKMRDRMVIIDPPPPPGSELPPLPDNELTTQQHVRNLHLPTSTYSVLYYPWVKVANPHYHAETRPDAPKEVLVPPSGFAAGMWSKIDARRGVWKAPAGVETSLLGVGGLEYDVVDRIQDQLNPRGINVIRQLPGFGPVIWGSRTLATKSKPEWKYVPVRRTASFIERSIYNGIQWAVFEPNDHRLWSSLRANVGGFMNGLFRAGAFQGEKVSDAYFVRCGLDDTMTQADINRGQVIVIVGFAPLKPAEFVIVRIQQIVGQ